MESAHQYLKALAVGLSMGLIASGAHGFSVMDVTFSIPPDAPEFADAAELLPGNDNLAGVNSLGGDFAGDPWALLDKTDDSSNEFMGVTFELTADVGEPAGNWTLDWAETGSPGLPLTMDFVFVTKAARDWGAYLFEAVEFTSDPMTGNGSFAISWVNGGGQTPDLSHASFYARDSGLVPDPDPNPVPVPGTLILLGLGLGALARSRRRGCAAR